MCLLQWFVKVWNNYLVKVLTNIKTQYIINCVQHCWVIIIKVSQSTSDKLTNHFKIQNNTVMKYFETTINSKLLAVLHFTPLLVTKLNSVCSQILSCNLVELGRPTTKIA